MSEKNFTYDDPGSTHFQGRIANIVHALSVRVLHQLRGCSNNHIETVDPGFYCDTGVVQMTSNVSEDFGLESKVADDLTISSRLFRRCRRSELDVFDSEGIQSFRYPDLGVCIKEGVGKLQEYGQSQFDTQTLGSLVTCSPSRKVLSIILKLETLER